MDKWEKEIEIYDMKFTVKCYYEKTDLGYTYRFIAYNKDNEPIANTVIQLEIEPTIDEFEKEAAEPSLKKLQMYILRKYVSSEFMTLIATKIHERAEKIDKVLRESLKKKWQTFVADNIRKAADVGEFVVNIIYNTNLSGDNIFEGGYDRDLMLVDTPNLLEARGFNVKFTENGKTWGDPNSFVMTISW